MKKSVPHQEGTPGVILFKMEDGSVLAVSGDIAARFKRAFSAEEIIDRFAVELSESDIKKEGNEYLVQTREGLLDMFTREQDHSVIISTNRLRHVLHGIESPWIRLDVLLNARFTHEVGEQVIEDDIYDHTKISKLKVDALRIVELVSPTDLDKVIGVEDEAIIMGVVRSQDLRFYDPSQDKNDIVSKRIAAVKKLKRRNRDAKGLKERD